MDEMPFDRLTIWYRDATMSVTHLKGPDAKSGVFS